MHEEAHSVLLDVPGIGVIALREVRVRVEPLPAPSRPGEPVENEVSREELPHDRLDVFPEAPEAQRVVLTDQGVAQLVHDQAGEIVPLCVDDPEGVCHLLEAEGAAPQSERGGDPAPEELPGAVQVTPPASGQHPDPDV